MTYYRTKQKQAEITAWTGMHKVFILGTCWTGHCLPEMSPWRNLWWSGDWDLGFTSIPPQGGHWLMEVGDLSKVTQSLQMVSKVKVQTVPGSCLPSKQLQHPTEWLASARSEWTDEWRKREDRGSRKSWDLLWTEWHPIKFICWNPHPQDYNVRKWGLWEVIRSWGWSPHEWD